jgi:hypothetical protein
MFAVLGMALAPTVSHALMAASGAQWAEICSTSGSRWVPLQAAAGQAGDETPATTSNPMDMPHCPLCCHLGGDTGLPPALAHTAVFLNDAAHVVPALFLRAPRTLFAWATAQPRGPPTPV